MQRLGLGLNNTTFKLTKGLPSLPPGSLFCLPFGTHRYEKPDSCAVPFYL